MRAITNIPWQSYCERRDRLQMLLRSKVLAVHHPDMRRGSSELRSLYPEISELKSELNVLRRVIAKQDINDDDHGGERRSRIEYRFAPTKSTSSFAQSQPAKGNILKLRGFAVLWDELSEDLGGFREKFVPSAFNDSLADDSPKFFLLEHTPPPLASTGTGDLTLVANSDGLHFEARLDKRDRLIQRAEPMLRARRNMSFAFVAKKDRWTQVRGQVVRTVLQAKLLEISAVKTPAYSQTSLAVAERSKWRAQAAARERHLQLITMR